MNVIYPKSVKIQMDEPQGFYFDIELEESPDGMMFSGWLHHTDYSFKSHIFSIQAETIRNDDPIDWFPIICMMSEYIKNNCLITHYWELIELIEY